MAEEVLEYRVKKTAVNNFNNLIPGEGAQPQAAVTTKKSSSRARAASRARPFLPEN